MRNINVVGMGLGMLALVLCLNTNASAAHYVDHHHHHGGVGIGLGFGVSESPTYVSGGHYEYRTETVMVSPSSVQQRFVPATYRTELLSTGVSIQVLVSNGYWESYTIPAQYESRSVQVWVPETYCSSPRVSVGLGFRF